MTTNLNCGHGRDYRTYQDDGTQPCVCGAIVATDGTTITTTGDEICCENCGEVVVFNQGPFDDQGHWTHRYEPGHTGLGEPRCWAGKNFYAVPDAGTDD